jgi:hypothetical protein
MWIIDVDSISDFAVLNDWLINESITGEHIEGSGH